MPMPEWTPQPIDEDSEYTKLSPDLLRAIHRYVQEGRSVGSFLTGLITNDLVCVVSHADNDNRGLIDVWVRYLFNRVPQGCWGSKEAMTKWKQGEKS